MRFHLVACNFVWFYMVSHGFCMILHCFVLTNHSMAAFSANSFELFWLHTTYPLDQDDAEFNGLETNLKCSCSLVYTSCLSKCTTICCMFLSRFYHRIWISILFFETSVRRKKCNTCVPILTMTVEKFYAWKRKIFPLFMLWGIFLVNCMNPISPYYWVRITLLSLW